MRDRHFPAGPPTAMRTPHGLMDTHPLREARACRRLADLVARATDR